MYKNLVRVNLILTIFTISYAYADDSLHVTYNSSESENMNYKQQTQKNNQVVFLHKKLKVLKTDNLEMDTKALLEEGYLCIKQDIFNARSDSIFPNFNYKQTIIGIENSAKKLDAEIVLFSSKNIGESVGYFFPNGAPVPKVDFKDMRNDIRVNAENFNNTASGETRVLDEYAVNYFIKFNSITGIYPINLTSKEINIYSNTGVKAVFISKDSPAIGIIKENDIIQKINEQPILDVVSFIEITNYLKQGTVKLELLRDGQLVMKEIYIN